MQTLKIWMPTLVSILMLVAYHFFIVPKDKPVKVAYVEVDKLYNEFKLFQEMDAQLTTTQSQRQLILDSLGLQIQSLERNGGSENDVNMLKHEYMNKQQQFAEDNQALAVKYQEEIVSQLNQYVQDYSETNEYDYILGATGEGGLMAAKKTENITTPVLQYINERYAGTSK